MQPISRTDDPNDISLSEVGCSPDDTTKIEKELSKPPYAWLERRFVEDQLVSEEIRYVPMTDAELSQLEVMYDIEVLKIVLIP